LIFHSGFEPDTANVGGDLSRDIEGIDLSVSAPNDWTTDLEGYPSFGAFRTGGFCDGATITANDHKVRIVDDPTGAVNGATSNVNRVLHLWNRDPDDTTCGWATRPTSQISDVDGSMPAVYFKFRLYLDADVALWAGCPGWLQLWEAKREITNSSDFFSLELLLVQAQNGSLAWRARNRVCCGSPQPSFQWEEDNESVPIPYDEWITAEIYWQKGTELDGRFVFTIQREGQPRQTLFDVTGATVYPPEPDSTMYQFKLATVYAAKEAAQCVDGKGGVLQAYWDDWEIWDGMLTR
jgi:hypothetical protein